MVVLGVAATILIVIRILWSAQRAARHEYKKRQLKKERKGLDEQKKVIELNPTRMKGAKSAMFDRDYEGQGHSPMTGKASKASSKVLAASPKQFENPSFRRFSSTNSTKSSSSSNNDNNNNSPGPQTMVKTRGTASSFCVDSPSMGSPGSAVGTPGSVGSRGSVCLDKNWLDSVGNSPASQGSQGSPGSFHGRGSRGDSAASGGSICLDNAWLDSVGGDGTAGSPAWTSSNGVRKSYGRRSKGRSRKGR